MLYKAYHEFEEQNIFDEKLEELYREGRRYVGLPLREMCKVAHLSCAQNFKPPPVADTAPSTSPPPQQFGSPNFMPTNSPFQINPSNAFNFLQSQYGSIPRNSFATVSSTTPSPNFFSNTPFQSGFHQHQQQPQPSQQQQSWRSHR
jgi:hypothetical protein